ncbi:FAR1 DNA-binding domain [Sesbania bispinosa]|nr:FAR1 DNA-binding domain [Sesbania bispinosa]
MKSISCEEVAKCDFAELELGEGKIQRNNLKKREPRPETRCGCFALLSLRIDFSSIRWFVKEFNDDHNHDMLEEKYCRMMAAHRKMIESDIMEMNNMRSASFASCCGG